MTRILKYMLNIAYILIFFIFLKLFFDIVCFDLVSRTSLNIFCKFLGFLLMSVIFAFVYFFLSKFSEEIKKFQLFIVVGFLFFLFIWQLIFGYKLQVTPLWDFSAVYDGAIEWLVKGSFYSFYEYYYYYPNNFGELTFLLFLFQIASRLGCHNFYFVAMVVNSLMCCGSVAVVFFVCKKLFSPVEGVFSLIIYALCPPMYLLAPVFYSDQLTMLFPVLLLLIFLCYEESERSLLTDEAFAFAFAFIGFIGFFIKPTVFIVIIAVCVSLVLKMRWKKLGLLVVNVLLVFCLLSVIKNEYFYTRHLDRQTAKELNTPIEVWIYMGLNEDPGFSGDDTEFARGISDPAVRKSELRRKISERIREYGFSGINRHLKEKEIYVFSDGTFELSYTFLFGFQKDTSLKQVLTTLGEYYGYYWEICSLHWYVVFLLGIIFEGYFCLQIFRKKHNDIMIKTFPVALSLFGLYLFFAIWEVHRRYMINYYSFFVIMAVGGMYGLQLMKTKIVKNKSKQVTSVSNNLN